MLYFHIIYLRRDGDLIPSSMTFRHTLNRTGLEAGAEKIVATAAAAAKLVRSDDAASEAAPANRLRIATNR